MPTTVTYTIGSALGSAGAGTISATNGSTAVVGAGTAFTTAFGADGFGTIQIDSTTYQVVSVTDDTHLTLKTNYAGTTGSGKSYVVGLRDFSTIQAWQDAAPADLVTADEVWRGECYNDSEFLGTTDAGLFSISGSTTDSTHYKELTTASGQSFRDNVNVQTNALRYNVSNGVGIRCNGLHYGHHMAGFEENYLRVSNLQFKQDFNAGGAGAGISVNGGESASNITLEYCIIEGNDTAPLLIDGATCVIKNSLILKTSGGGDVAQFRNNAQALFCTFAIPSDLTAGTMIQNAYGSPVVKGCAFFGASDIIDTATIGSVSNCFTDLAGDPDGCTTVATDPFESSTSSAPDYRLKSGSSLIDIIATDLSTGITDDIAGTSRPSGSSWDAGCWEFLTAGGGSSGTPLILPASFSGGFINLSGGMNT